MTATKVRRHALLAAGITALALGVLSSCGAVAHATESPYTTVVWLIPNDDLDPNAQNQPFVGAMPGSDIAGAAALMECGHRYQVDVYRPLPDGTPPSTLWAGGVLRPNHDGPFLAYDLPFTPYAVVTTPACTEEPTPSPSTPPTSVPPTSPAPIPTTTTPSTSTSPTPTSTPDTPTPGSPVESTPPTAPTSSPTASSTTTPTSTSSPATPPLTPSQPAPTSSTVPPSTPNAATSTSPDALAYTGDDDVWGRVVGAAILVILGALGVYFGAKRERDA